MKKIYTPLGIKVWIVLLTVCNYVLDIHAQTEEQQVQTYIQVQSGHTYEVTGIAKSPNDSLFATISKDATVRIWLLKGKYRGSLIRVLYGHKDPITKICWKPDDNNVIATMSESEVFLWKVSTGGKSQVALEGVKPININFDWGNSYLSVCCKRSKVGCLLRYDVSKPNKILNKLDVECIDFDAETIPTCITKILSTDQEFLMGCENGKVYKIKLINKSKTEIQATSTPEKVGVYDILQDNTRDNIIVVFKNGALWTIKDNNLSTHTNAALNGNVMWVSQSLSKSLPNSDITIITEKNSQIRYVWRFDEMNKLQKINTELKGKLKYQLPPTADGTIVLVEDHNSIYTVLHFGRLNSNKTEFKDEYILPRSGGKINAVVGLTKPKLVITGDNEGNLVQWDVRDIKDSGNAEAQYLVRPHIFENFVGSICTNDDNTHIAVSGNGDWIKVINVIQNKIIDSIQTEPTKLIDFISNAKLIIVTDSTFISYDLHTKNKKLLNVHVNGSVKLASLTPDKNYFLIVTDNGDIIKADINTGESIVFTQKVGDVIGSDDKITVINNDSLALLTENKLYILGKNDKKFPPPVVNGDMKTLIYDRNSASLFIGYENGKLVQILIGQLKSNKRETVKLFESRILSTNLFKIDTSTIILCGSDEGAVSMYSLSNPDLRYYGYPFFSSEKLSWAVYTSDNRYDTDIDGLNSNECSTIRFVNENQVYSIADVVNKSYTPKILSQLGNGKFESITRIEVGTMPPEIRFINIPSEPVTKDSIIITAEITVRQLGLASITVYRNGIQLDDPIIADFPDSIRIVNLKSFVIPLVPDTNKISIVCVDKNSIKSPPTEAIIISKQTVKSSTLYIVSVGVNTYKDTNATLRFAVNDALEISDEIGKSKKNYYKDILLIRLMNENATRKNVLDTLKSIIKHSTHNDAFIFYFAGHGVINKTQQYTLVLNGVDNINNSENVTRNGITIDTLKHMLMKINASRQLVILDACYSGQAIKSLTYNDISSTAKQIGGIKWQGVNVMASVQGEGKALESENNKHGIFTNSLLKCLRGESDRYQLPINVDDLISFIREEYRNGNLRNQKPMCYYSDINTLFVLSDKK